MRSWGKFTANVSQGARMHHAAVDALPSPGTASCLSGMALSLEGSEPIQSALALPMPAGRVFMPEAVRDLTGNSTPFVTNPTRAFLAAGRHRQVWGKMSPQVKTCTDCLPASRNASSPSMHEHHRLDSSTILLARSSTCYPPLLLSWLKWQWQGRRSGGKGDLNTQGPSKDGIIMAATPACNCLVNTHPPPPPTPPNTTNFFPLPSASRRQLRNGSPIWVPIPRAHNSL